MTQCRRLPGAASFAARSVLSGIIAFLVSGFPFRVAAQDTGWIIRSFHADYQINPDRSIDVTETISVDFGPLQKHGIYREINTTFRRIVADNVPVQAGTTRIKLDLHSATDGQRNALETQVERGARTRIRIGSVDIIVTGPQTYIIRYTLERGLGFFERHDELYWQVTGTEWPVPIARATAVVRLPSHQPADSGYEAWCYAGWYESNDQSRCMATASAQGEYRFESGQLDPGEGLTLVAAFPKGIVPAPTSADKFREKLALWWPVPLPLLVLLGMFWRWWKVGREPNAGAIVPNWHAPKELPPGSAGTLVDQRAGMDDIVATLLDLAVRGYITIREVPPDGVVAADNFLGKALRSLELGQTDWEITATSKPRTDLTRYESMVFTGVLEGDTSRKMSDLHNDFYKHIPRIKEAMYDDVVERGLFLKRPESTRNRYRALGFVFLVLAPMLGFPLQNGIVAIALGLSGAIIFAFASAMPAMTNDGAKRFAEVKGLEEYIRRAEKLELELRQSPHRTTELFETLLPYAIALRVSDIWLKQFASVLSSQPPTWYVGSNVGQFNVAAFHDGLSGFQTAAARTMGSSPGSSSGSGGGGSVGGGGGGGGGGSW